MAAEWIHVHKAGVADGLPSLTVSESVSCSKTVFPHEVSVDHWRIVFVVEVHWPEHSDLGSQAVGILIGQSVGSVR